jgi:hypothetical protein
MALSGPDRWLKYVPKGANDNRENTMNTTKTLTDSRQQDRIHGTAPTVACTAEPPAAPLTDAMQQTVKSSLLHAMDLNRHRTELLRLSADPAIAHSLYSLLTYLSAGEGGPALAYGGEHSFCVGCWTDHYHKRGLLEADEENALVTAAARVAQWAVGLRLPLNGDEIEQITYNPEAMVRAAYALARNVH